MTARRARNVAFFPLARFRSKMSEAARALDATTTEDECKALWQCIAGAHGGDLCRIGADQAEIDRQLDEFAHAVTWELVEMAC